MNRYLNCAVVFCGLSFLMVSCIAPIKVSNHTTTPQIPNVTEKGDFSSFGAIGTTHVEAQAAYSPVENWVVQSGAMIGPEKTSIELGLGYLFKPQSHKIIGIRGMWGYHENHFEVFDPEIVGTNWLVGDYTRYGVYGFHNYHYLHNTWSAQLDYTYKRSKASWFFGVKMNRTNYRYAHRSMGFAPDNIGWQMSRENFHDYFLNATGGFTLSLGKRFAWMTSITYIDLMGYKEGDRAYNSEPFQHNFLPLLISNGITFSIGKK
jgi:hypothetical protein